MFERFVGCRLSYVELYDGCRVSYVVGPRDSVLRIGVRTAYLLNLLTYKQGSNIPGDIPGDFLHLEKDTRHKFRGPALHTGAACMLPVGPVLRHEYRILFLLKLNIRFP